VAVHYVICKVNTFLSRSWTGKDRSYGFYHGVTSAFQLGLGIKSAILTMNNFLTTTGSMHIVCIQRACYCIMKCVAHIPYRAGKLSPIQWLTILGMKPMTAVIHEGTNRAQKGIPHYEAPSERTSPPSIHNDALLFQSSDIHNSEYIWATF